jgi:hypothetical protein
MLLHDLTKELYIHFTLQKGCRSPEKEKKKELKPRKKKIEHKNIKFEKDRKRKKYIRG